MGRLPDGGRSRGEVRRSERVATPPPDDADEGALQRIFGWPPATPAALLLALLAVALTLFYAWRRSAAIVRKQVLAGARGALALLLSGAMTVIGLPGCAGGGGGRESWQPTSFVGPDDEVVFLHAPMLGTPAIQTDRRGQVHNRQLSTPYGVRTAHEGADPDSFRFTDKEWDEFTGLIYFGARYYDAELGTWISVDPLALWGDDGSLSPFDLNATAYVGVRVTIAVDEFGFEGLLFRPMRHSGEEHTDALRNLYEPQSCTLADADLRDVAHAAGETMGEVLQVTGQEAVRIWNDGGKEVALGTTLVVVTVVTGGASAPATAAVQVIYAVSASSAVGGGVTMATIGAVELASDDTAEGELRLDEAYAAADCASSSGCFAIWAIEAPVTGEEMPSETAELSGVSVDLAAASFSVLQLDPELWKNVVDVVHFANEAGGFASEVSD